MENTMKIYDELRADLNTAFLPVTRSVSASLMESEAISQSVERKCWQTLWKKVDECIRKLNTEQDVQLQKLQKAIEQKNKVNELPLNL